MSGYHLAQLNVAQLLAPLESEQLSGFVDNLERINAAAEQSRGFVWRLQDEAGDATGFRPFGEEMLVNLSVWQDVASLHDFVYQSDHVEIMRGRTQWFARVPVVTTVLWWIEAGRLPTIEEASEKLELIRSEGPGSAAFSFQRQFPAPGAVAKGRHAGS